MRVHAEGSRRAKLILDIQIGRGYDTGSGWSRACVLNEGWLKYWNISRKACDSHIYMRLMIEYACRSTRRVIVKVRLRSDGMNIEYKIAAT